MGNITIPKALIEIDGKSNLHNTLDLIGHKFRTVYIVVADEMLTIVNKTINSWDLNCNIVVFSIESGGGDGKAILEAYNKAKYYNFIINPKCVILWGDAHLRSSDIVDELLNIEYDEPLLIPVYKEKNPYVSINIISKNAISADFTKYGEIHEYGFHDQSIFGIKWSKVISALNIMRCVTFKEDEYGHSKFTTQSGELTFLNIIHYFWNIGEASKVYETKYPLMGYNTPEEVEKIRMSIKCNNNLQ